MSTSKITSSLSSKTDYSKLLPDCVKPDINVLFVGINPGEHTAKNRHHYAGPHNHFWTCLFESGLVDQKYTSNEDYLLPKTKYKIGLTNIVKRPTKTAAELSENELKLGAIDLLKLLSSCRAKIIVFNGMVVFRTFLKHALNLERKIWNSKIVYGRQPDYIKDCIIFAMPSSSPRAALFPAARDKTPFYVAIREMVEELESENENETNCE